MKGLDVVDEMRGAMRGGENVLDLDLGYGSFAHVKDSPLLLPPLLWPCGLSRCGPASSPASFHFKVEMD